MKIGLFIGSFESYADPQIVLKLALKAEEMGFHGVFLPDHLHYGNQSRMGFDAPSFLDPWIMLAAIATQTSKIKLGTWITPIPRRLPWQLARNLATLDHLSNGRVILGGGLGAPPADYEDYGIEYNPKELAEKMDESLEIINGLWSDDPFSFEGKHYTISNVNLYPKPVQKPRIPIFLGGRWPSKKPVMRAAKWDGLMPVTKNFPMGFTEEELDEMIALFSSKSDNGEILISSSPDSPPPKEFVTMLESKGITWVLFAVGPMVGSIEDSMKKIETIASQLDLV